MGVKEFKYDLFRAGYVHSPSPSTDTENETIIQEWQVLFPEVAQDNVNFDEEVENDDQEPVKSNNRKRLWTLSNDSSSGDSIEIDDKFLVIDQPSTSNEQGNKFAQPIIIEDISSSSSTVTLSELENYYTEHTAVHDVAEFSSRKPPIPQVMRKDDQKYDPQRIPASVFERCDSLIPAEWSAASNESLFSLHIGNNSIGRDDQMTFLLSEELKKYGGTLPKSLGELASGDLNELRKLSGLLNKPNDEQVDIHEISHEGDQEVELKTSDNKNDTSYAEREEEVLKMIAAFQFGNAKRIKQNNVNSSSTSMHSNTSEDSNYSFAFPVFGEAEKNALAKGFLQKQYSNNSQQDIRSPKLALQALAPRTGGNKFFSCFLRIFSCNSCCRCHSCHCPSCFPSRSSCTPSCFSLPSRRCCFGWTSRFSCASCKKACCCW